MANGDTGRTSAHIASFIRSGVLTGKYPVGKYIPPTRELGDRYSVSPETVRRALKVLEREELLESVPRHGFRVAGSGGMLAASCPVAYVTYFQEDLSDAHAVNLAVNTALQSSAAARGWTVLGAHSGDQDLSQLIDKLLAARVWGIVLDCVDSEVLGQLRGADLPVVMTNSWFENVDVDVVLQDNYRGGFQAAQYLVKAGAKRIAWIGPIGRFSASRERFAGAVAGLAASGRSFDPSAIIDVNARDSQPRLRKLMSGGTRPDGACVFWKGLARAVKSVCDEQDVALGRDLTLVGWAVEEFYEMEHAATYAGGTVPAAVVWRAADMADAALDRLEARRRGLKSGTARISVPTRIRGAQ
ncbi:MAG: GntR family transcriptional regulator [Planctomycetota bacterium]|jgi:DNA-binding LacI/PurR family transcriptional regulator